MKDKRERAGFPRRTIFRGRRGPRPGALEWPRDLSGRCARATAIGSNRLLVENYTGILELTDARVRLSTGGGPITVTGRNLQLCDARRGTLIITGQLERVELPCAGGDDAP